MLLKDEGCPLEVLLELRIVVLEAVKNKRLNKVHINHFDLVVNSKTLQNKIVVKC
jgi:hypothetical protein